jgi:hypothetical protein
MLMSAKNLECLNARRKRQGAIVEWGRPTSARVKVAHVGGGGGRRGGGLRYGWLTLLRWVVSPRQ